MIRATSVSEAGLDFVEASDTITLAFDDRQRRRIALTSDHGTDFLLDLPKTVSLKEGYSLVLDDGSFIAVKAAPEHLLQITCADALHLSRIAWHLGNRHLAAQIEQDHILIRYDHVIADLVKGLGAEVCEVNAPFEPESGAYAHGHAHG